MDETTSPQELGARGEEAAARFLERKGMEILERNWTCSAGEADIICRDEDTLCFVEVKTRSTVEKGFPAEAVDERKAGALRAHRGELSANLRVVRYPRALRRHLNLGHLEAPCVSPLPHRCVRGGVRHGSANLLGSKRHHPRRRGGAGRRRGGHIERYSLVFDRRCARCGYPGIPRTHTLCAEGERVHHAKR